MQVVTETLPARLGVQVERGNGRLVIAAGWGQEPYEILQAAMPHLAPREVLEVARALGMPVPPPETT